MSKVITHTRSKIADIQKGHAVREKGSGYTQGDTGYQPISAGINPNSKQGRRKYKK